MEANNTILRFVNFSGFVINNDRVINNIIIYGSNGEIYVEYSPSYSEFTYLVFQFETKLKKKKDLTKNIPFYIKEDGRYNFYIPASLVDFTFEETNTRKTEIHNITTSTYRIFNIVDGVGHWVLQDGTALRICVTTKCEYNDEYKKAEQIAKELNEISDAIISAYDMLKILRAYDITKKK